MSTSEAALVQEYTASLRDYCGGRGEAALRRAYEAGRRALAEGLGVLNMVAAHRAALADALDPTGLQIDQSDLDRFFKHALSCFAESLSPFEMALRGVQEANARLQDSLSSLEVVENQLRQQNRELLAAHRAVEEERGRYQALFEFAPDGYLVTGLEGAIREANAAAAGLLNTPQKHLPGQSLIEFVEGLDQDAFRRELRAIHLGTLDRVEDWQVSIRPRNKPAFPAALTVVAERTFPAYANLRWLIRDATERKRLEKERARWLIARTKAQEARRFEFLATASSLLSGSLDIEANLRNVTRLTGEFLSSWCFMTVCDPGGSMRQMEIGHAENSASRLANALRRHCLFSGRGAAHRDLLLAGPRVIEPLTADWLDRAADSPEHAVLLHELCGSCAMVFPFRIHNRLMGVLTLISAVGTRRYRSADHVLCEDLSRRCGLALENVRLYREVVAERDKAERASRAKDEFVAILGHELRNPLTPVIGWIRILRNHPLILQDPVLAEGVQAVERNTSMLTRLVEDCADLAKISAGKIQVERAPVDVNHLVATSVEAVQEKAAERGLELAVELTSEPTPALGDAVRLKQVVMNLLTNAVKFTNPGGHISIRTGAFGEETEIAVQDSGIGIDPVFIEQIFEPFRQGTSAWLTSQSGLGLGLAIARRIVAMHGGRIWAESRGLGTGTTLKVRLPAAGAAPQGKAPIADPLPQNSPSLRILLIEDSPDILFLMKVELEGMGHVVSTAANGRSGLEMARTDPPDLIVSDIKMPLADGYELIRAIRRIPELQQIPAIALTGFGARPEIESALAAGFDAYLSKPAEPEDLATLIRLFTERKDADPDYPAASHPEANPPKAIAKDANNPEETTA